MRTLPTSSLSLTAILLFSLVLLPLAARAADCNGNGIDDADDIAAGTSEDCNRNYVPDECDIAPAAFLLEEPSVFPAGGTLDAVYGSIYGGRQGHMPHWENRFSPSEIRLLALYVDTLEPKP